ncbi:MAG: GIY-YIG nuclease family protein [Bacilli bacterium]|nr:GIY-YIG nuclease family protein [Bacilli bacterium]
MSGDESAFGSIYIMKNFVNGKYYVGQTIQSSQERFSQHIREAYAEDRREYNYCISRAIRKYGKEAFDFAVLADQVPIEMLDIVEEHYIDMYMTTDPKYGYNVSVGHRDTSNFKKYKRNEEPEPHFEEISDEDIDRILEEF